MRFCFPNAPRVRSIQKVFFIKRREKGSGFNGSVKMTPYFANKEKKGRWKRRGRNPYFPRSGIQQYTWHPAQPAWPLSKRRPCILNLLSWIYVVSDPTYYWRNYPGRKTNSAYWIILTARHTPERNGKKLQGDFVSWNLRPLFVEKTCGGSLDMWSNVGKVNLKSHEAISAVFAAAKRSFKKHKESLD